MCITKWDLSNEYGQKRLDSAKKSGTDAIKTASKKSNQKNSKSNWWFNWQQNWW